MPLEERPEPVAGPGHVVVAVRASGICGSDVHGFTGSTGRRRMGVVMGHEAAKNSATDYVAVQLDAFRVSRGLATFFETCDVFMSPTLC